MIVLMNFKFGHCNNVYNCFLLRTLIYFYIGTHTVDSLNTKIE